MSKRVVIQSFAQDCCFLCKQPGQTTGLSLRGTAEGMVHLFEKIGMRKSEAMTTVEYYLNGKGKYGFGIKQRQEQVSEAVHRVKIVLCPACAGKAGMDIGPLDGSGERPVYVEQEIEEES